MAEASRVSEKGDSGEVGGGEWCELGTVKGLVGSFLTSDLGLVTSTGLLDATELAAGDEADELLSEETGRG